MCSDTVVRCVAGIASIINEHGPHKTSVVETDCTVAVKALEFGQLQKLTIPYSPVEAASRIDSISLVSGKIAKAF